MDDHKGTLQIDYDGITMKTKLILKRSGGLFGTLSLMKNRFLTIYCIFRHIGFMNVLNAIHADSPGVYNSEKILNSSTNDKLRSKYDIIDGPLVCGKRQPIFLVLC